MKQFLTIGRAPWTGDQPDAMPLPTKENPTQKDEDKHSCYKQNSNPRCQRPRDQGIHLRERGHWNRRFYWLLKMNFIIQKRVWILQLQIKLNTHFLLIKVYNTIQCAVNSDFKIYAA
jgi:hypothetical protein